MPFISFPILFLNHTGNKWTNTRGWMNENVTRELEIMDGWCENESVTSAEIEIKKN